MLLQPRLLALLAVLAVLAVLAAGCGGGGGLVGGSLPGCAQESRRTDLPAGLPAGLPSGLPLPPGLVLTDARRLAPGQFHVRGVVRGDLDGVAGFFERRLPESGFALGRGDAEAHEQESPFTGRGYRGSWRVVEHPGDCPVVAVFLVLIEQR